MQCRVQDETDTPSLVLFEKEVKSLLNGASPYQLLATRERIISHKPSDQILLILQIDLPSALTMAWLAQNPIVHVVAAHYMFGEVRDGLQEETNVRELDF